MDIEVTVPADQRKALDIVTVEDIMHHLRMSKYECVDQVVKNLESAVIDACAKLDGVEGTLNRTILPCTWTRYFERFPCGDIMLPYPPFIGSLSIEYTDENGDAQTVAPSGYVRFSDCGVPKIRRTSLDAWPVTTGYMRSVSVSYEAGIVDLAKASPNLKRAIKLLAGHFYENPEASINEPRQMQINRKIVYGLDDLLDQLTLPHQYDESV